MSVGVSVCKAPEWINRAFMERILMNAESDQGVKLIRYELKTEADMHFSSDMFKACLEYETKDGAGKFLRVVIKYMPENDGFRKDTLSTANIFSNEIKMYSQTLPKCQELLRDINHNTAMFPRMIYASQQPHQFLVLEDLTARGFKTLSKRLPNAVEAKLILEKLAMFHAVTYKMYYEGDNSLSKYKGTSFSFPHYHHDSYFVTGIDYLIEVVREIPGYEHYITKLKQIDPKKLLEKCFKTCETLGSYNVLNHGDFHSNNMMFQFDDDDIATDVMILDYQLPHWGTPAYDLMYAFADIDEAVDDLFDPIEFYFDKFSKVLKAMKFTGVLRTFDQLMEEINLHCHIELFLFVTFGCFVSYFDDDYKCGAESIFDSPEERKRLHKTKTFRNRIKKILPIFERKGYFDLDDIAVA